MSSKEIKEAIFYADQLIQKHWSEMHEGVCHWVIEDDEHLSLFTDDDFETVAINELFPDEHKYSAYSKFKKKASVADEDPKKEDDEPVSKDNEDDKDIEIDSNGLTKKKTSSELLSSSKPSKGKKKEPSEEEISEDENAETENSEEKHENESETDQEFFEHRKKILSDIFGADDEDEEKTKTEKEDTEDEISEDGYEVDEELNEEDVLPDNEVLEDEENAESLSDVFDRILSENNEENGGETIEENSEEKSENDGPNEEESDILEDEDELNWDGILDEIIECLVDCVSYDVFDRLDGNIEAETSLEDLGLSENDLETALLDFEIRYDISFKAIKAETIGDILNYVKEEYQKKK